MTDNKGDHAAIPQLDPALLDQLRVEFGDHGERAVGFLETAWCLLDNDVTPPPRLGEVVAYCLREALTEIPKASDATSGPRLRDLSREVVEAAKRHEMAAEPPSEETVSALRELLSAINTMDDFHREGKGIHRERMIALMIERSGVEPLSSGTAPIVAYQGLLDRVNPAAHGNCSVADARGFWSECVALLRQLFSPPDVRNRELDQLALDDDPSDADLLTVLTLAATPVHLRRFLSRVTSPSWLWLFDRRDLLNTREGELWSSVCSAAVRLAGAHRENLLSWLAEMHEKYAAELVAARCIADAACQLGGSALDVLLKIVRRYPTDRGVIRSGIKAALELDASDRTVFDLADVLMDEDSWGRAFVANRLAAHVVDGINERNSVRRIKLFCFKLLKVPNHDLVLGSLRLNRQGSIADRHSMFPDERSSILLGSLTRAVRVAWDWMSATELVDATSGLPAGLVDRLRAWILANAPAVDADAIAAELENAISSRNPTGDDVALLDRAIELCNGTALRDRCQAALGDVPTVAQVSQALGADRPLPERWLRSHSWVAVLPSDMTEAWTVPCRVLATKYGEIRRENLLQRTPFEAQPVGSPIDTEELRAMPPTQAAQTIARWRPRPHDWQDSARQLARTLETLVKEDPRGWVSEPVSIAAELRHPTYISHYLEAVAELATDTMLPVTELLDVIQLVWHEPWPAVPLGDSHLDYDNDWRGAKRSAVSLIRALANADADFSERDDEAWSIIESAASDLSEPSFISDDTDPLTRAINRSCTRAFETALLFVAAKLRASRPVRPAFEELLGFGLRLEGGNGAEYRAILAPRLAWLRHTLPEWTTANLGALLGDEAPDGLAQTTIDMAIQWSQPNPWLLTTYPEMIQDAATRHVKRAMGHLLVGMLWECSGYQVGAIVRFLESHPDLVSNAGIRLSTLINDDEPDPSHIEVAVALWQALLASRAVESMEGFGSFSEVTGLDTDRWADLTITTLARTGGRIDWADRVANRAMSQPPTTTKLDILNQLIRGQLDPWDLRYIADRIANYLRTATDLTAADEYHRLRTTLIERGMIDD